MVGPADLWPPYKREWYDDRTGELKEPHRSRLLANGTSIARIVEMESQVKDEIARFHRQNAEMPLVAGKNWAQQQLEQREKFNNLPDPLRRDLHQGAYDPDKNYD